MFLASFGNSTAQTTSNYVFSASSGTYTPITGTTFAPAGDADEGAYNDIPIGFTFRYWNTDYTTVSASTNGWLTFGQSIIADPYYGFENNLAGGSYIPLAAPLWDDMAINSGSYEDFSYTTKGSQPNRIFTAQWTGMKWKYDATGDVISFQVKLYEVNGKIEFIYNQGSADVNDGSASIGIAGPGASGNNFISLSGTGSNPVASSVTETADLNTRPANGQVYSFIPGTMSVSSPSQVPSGNIFRNSVNNLISAFQVTAIDASAVLSSISFTTSGTSTSGEISNLKLFHSNTSTFPGGSPLQTISAYSGSGTYRFSGLSQQVNGGSTGYFWITCDTKSSATFDRTIKVAVNPVLSFLSGSPSGTITEGGNQTIKGAAVTISSPNPAVPAGNISQGSINNVIYRFDNAVVNENTSMTALTITTGGNYVASDLSNIKIWYSSDAAFDPADILFGTLTTALGPGAHYFTKLNRLIPVNTTSYIFVTVDATCSASASKTISVNAVTTSDVSFSAGTVKSGSTGPGEIQTIQNAILLNAASPSATPNTITANLSWTNPSGCHDEIMIVAKEAGPVTGTPTGDGSSYSANLSYGLGTGFGGGFVVYKGLTSPQTVTGLSASTQYYFKFFTRNGSQWSSGIEINTTTGAPSSSDYQSAATGDWQTLATWQIYKGGSWQTPDVDDGTPTSASGNIILKNGHNITNTSTGLNVDQITIEAGSNLINTGTISISGVVNGTITNSGTVTASGSMSFNSGSSYIHNRDGGSIPSATWNPASTCNITGVSVTVPSGLNQAFGNFTWNCTSQSANLDLGGNPAVITGTFTMTSTGSNSISPGGNVIYGNYSQAGGTYSLLGGNTVARTLSVSNFSMEGGQLIMSDAAGTAGTLNVSGNFSHTAGTISETTSGNGNIVFKGSFNGTTGMQTFSSGGTVSGAINFTVNSGAYLQMAEAGTIVSGDGTFTLSSGSTLGITSGDGISQAGATGNVQPNGSRSYSTGANYIYNGNGAQSTGTGLPTAALTGSVTVAGTSNLTPTNSIISNSYLTVNGIFTPGAGQIISGTGNITGFGTVKVTRTAATADFLSQYTIAGKILTNLTVDYAVLTGGQVISPVSYSNLKLSNSVGTNTIAGSVSVASTLTTTGGGTLTIGGTGLLTASSLTNNGIITFNPNAKGTITNIVNNGTLNLESGATAISSLITDNFSGNNPNIQLYVPASYHYISSPFSNMLASSITGEPNNSAIMEYRENLVTNNMNNGWVTTTGNHYDPISESWPSGFGTWNDMHAGHGYNYYSDAPYTYTLAGSINTSNKSVNLVYNSGQSVPAYPTQQGYNLLGNPFTSSMNWDVVVANNSSLFGSSVEQAIYFRLNGITVVYNNGVTNPNTYNPNGNLIPPLQGFFVKANSNATGLVLPAGARLHSASKRYKGLEETIPLIRLDLTGSAKSDQTVVRFDEKATTAFDGEFDAYKFMPSTDDPTISSSTNGIEYSINGIPFPESPMSIPLIINAPVTGSYTINANELTGLDGYHVYLSDNLLGTNVDLRESPDYIFSSVSGKIQDRFVLSISNLMTAIPENRISKHPFNIFARDNMINIQTLGDDWNGKKGNIKVLDMNGRVMATRGDVYFEKGGLTQIPFNAEKGIYFVEIKSGVQRYTGKVLLN